MRAQQFKQDLLKYIEKYYGARKAQAPSIDIDILARHLQACSERPTNVSHGWFRWTAEFRVKHMWVADGFELTEARALNMLAEDLRFANIGRELGVKIINAPPQALIRKAQGYDV